MLGIGRKKSPVPAETGSLNATATPSWLQGTAPNPLRKKKPKVDAGGQLTRQAMRAA